jgi:predicted nucleotidyltransferase
MLKEGKHRAVRNITIGWLSHAIHSTDYSERVFRIAIEISLMLICFNLIMYRGFFNSDIFSSAAVTVIVCHTIMWMLDGNFWVYMLDSFDWMRNPGIKRIISYVKLCRKLFQVADLCNAILIYGSMCRGEFHDRSDLDLRIIRRNDSWLGMLCLPVALFLRIISFFVILPVDLQVADSYEFINRQMRKDELPVVVHLRDGFNLKSTGKRFGEIEKNPASVFRKEKAQRI